MTVLSTTNRKTFVGNGVTTSFGTSPVVFFETSDLDIRVVVTLTGVETALTEGTHYTVTGGEGTTGTVDLSGGSSPYGAPASTETLVILRELPITQEVDFENNDINDAEVLEQALDRQTMVNQQQADSIDRSLKLSSGDVSGVDVTLPTPAGGNALGWSLDGLSLVNIALSVGTSLVDLAVAAGSTLIGWAQAGASAALRTVSAKLRERVSVKDFGAVGDGVTNDTAAIQAAIDLIESIGGGTVFIPAGTYLLSAALTIDDDCVTLQGDGVVSTILKPNAGNLSGIVVGVAGAITQGTQIRDLRVEYGSATTVTAGNGILLLHTYYPVLENVYINNPYVGLAIAPSVGVRINNCHIVGFNANGAQYGIDMYGDSNVIADFPTIPTQIFVEGTQVFGPQIDGFQSSVRIRAGEQVSIRDSYLAQGDDYNIEILQDANNWSILDVFINDTYIDAATTAGVLISGAAGNGSNNIQNIHISNCVLKGQSGDGTTGISVDGTSRGSTYPQALNGLKISNCTIAGWKGNGIDLGGGYGTTITGSEIKGNNYLNTLSACGVIVGAASKQTTITGNRIGGDAFSANSGSAFQVVGVRMDAGCANVSVIANDVTGNTTGVANNSGTADNYVQDNLGHVPTQIGLWTNIPIGPVALTSLGTSAVHVAGTIYVAEIYVPHARRVNGIGVLNGATAATDNLIVGLYGADGGAVLANSTLAGTLATGANGFQNIPLTAAINVQPGRYFVAVQASGTTTTTRRIAANTYLNYSKTTAGSFGTLSSLTVPTNVTADAGPIAYLF
jgi:hypothetical protein